MLAIHLPDFLQHHIHDFEKSVDELRVIHGLKSQSPDLFAKDGYGVISTVRTLLHQTKCR